MTAETYVPGDIYEDCAFHPVLCLEVNEEEDFIRGISLIDGTEPRECSLRHCGIRKLTLEEARQIKHQGPADPADRKLIGPDQRWW